MKINRLILFFVLFASSFSALPQDVEFLVSAPSVVAQGEQFRLTFTLNARPQEFNPPSFENFYILAGPSTSSSSSVEIVNGKMTQTFNYSYTYILEATAEGKFTIEAAKVTVSRKEYSTQPFTIEVVKGTSRASSQGNQGQQGAQQSTSQPDNDMFVSVELNQKTIYRGEAVLATIAIYTRSNIAGFEDIKFPSFTGFWNQEVETPNNVTFQRVNLGGKIYNMGILKKYLLFPQRTGEIKIDPFEIVVLSQQRSGRSQSIFDDFFGSYQTVRKRLASKPVALKVKELPANAPASFSGAVGRFSYEANLDKEKIKTNEAVTLQVRISGSGNLRLIETPKIEFPGGFEKFDPKVSDNINTTSQGATGSKTFDFVAIPRTPGKFDLGQVEFTYFDPVKNQYITLKSKPIEIEVETDGSETGTLQAVGFGKEDVKFIGRDIRFIKTETGKLSKGIAFIIGTPLLPILFMIPFAIAIVAFLVIQKNRKLNSNIALVKTRKARKVAQQKLKQARKFMEELNSELFYNELLRAMWGYVSDKLSIPVANLTSDLVKEKMLAQSINEQDVDEFVAIISTCEYTRYAPKSETSQMTDVYHRAHNLISRIEGTIKKM
ncbi:MAG TPA: BatD family protein [Tenuifilaceae bacterium]|nr:BatD family protein [Tenuifilaceae bacterium]